METVRVLVSAMSHMPLWSVWRDSGVAERHGIKLDIDVAEWALNGREARRMQDRAELLRSGAYAFLSGLHHEPYMSRASGDKGFVYLAQAQNDWDDRLVVAAGITDPRQLEGGKVVVSSQAPCVVGNLREALRIAGARVEAIEFSGGDRPRSESFGWAIDAVESGPAVGAAVDLPFDNVARRRGLSVLELPPVPVIHNVTICSRIDWVDENRELTRSFLWSMVEAVQFFKTQPERVREILAANVAPAIGITQDEDIAYLQSAWAGLLNVKPYPHPLAIWNVYRLDVANDPEASRIDPLEPWDLSLLRELDNAGIFEDLYAEPVRNPAVTALI